MAVSHPLPRPGELVGRYRVAAEVAHGGMAAVYAVTLEQAGGVQKLFAMKVLLPHLADDTRFVDMFLDEARIAAEIHDPNVVQMFEVGEHRGRPFMVMEYLRGQSLAAVLRRTWETEGARIGAPVVLAILAAAARGLHGAHEAKNIDGQSLGVVHRDVSPQNVHVGYDGQVKVVDFGIAAARGRVTSTRTGEVKGKLEFLAPEQLHRKSPVDRRTDVWAMGVMLWQIFGRERLFRGESDADTMFNVLHKEIPDIQRNSPRLHDDLATMIMRCLEREPDRRPDTMREVAHALDAASTALGGAGGDAIAETMARIFAVERATENERLAASMRGSPPAPLHESENSSGRVKVVIDDEHTTLPDARTPGHEPEPKRRRLAWVGVGLAGAAAVATAIVWATGVTEGAASEPAPAEPAATATAEAPPPAPERRTIRVAVDDAIRMVLVDGRLHEERPLAIDLGHEESVPIVMVGPDGEEHRTIGAADDGATLELTGRSAERQPPERRRTRRRATMSDATAPDERERVEAGGTGLLDVPL